MNRRNFMHLIGAAIAAPVIGASLPGAVSDIPILHAHDATAPIVEHWVGRGDVIDGLWLWMHQEDE